eukprot:scaffold496_cov236-Pinguiococcus_pyrenoidosus.AAC.12
MESVPRPALMERSACRHRRHASASPHPAPPFSPKSQTQTQTQRPAVRAPRFPGQGRAACQPISVLCHRLASSNSSRNQIAKMAGKPPPCPCAQHGTSPLFL